MIEMPRPPFDFCNTRLKVFGLGSAGCNILDRIVLDGLEGIDLVAINTDAQSLAGSVAPHKVQIGQTITRGLGAGGDPEIGRTAAEEGIGEILSALADATIVILVAGLGGGTGSGALPVVAEISREHNALVIVVATMPFRFEGRRRHEQAMQTLAAVEEKADLLICFENDRMAEIVSAKAGVQEAFSLVDQTLSQCIRSLAGLARRGGPMHVGFDEIGAAFSLARMRALFGVGEAQGDNRAHEAIAAALKNPLLDRGRQLKEIEVAAIHIAGGSDLTLHEVQTVTDELHRHLPEQARLFFGVAVDPALAGKLSVSILASTSTEPIAVLAPPLAEAEPELDENESLISAEDLALAEEEELEAIAAADTPSLLPEIETAPPPPKPATTGGSKLFAPLRNLRKPAAPEPPAEPAKPAAPKKDAKKEQKLEQMQFEPVNRGRFEKSEPTIIDGQDLDVPTFMRRNVRVK
jgi:cell division protein FtsZ